MSNIFLKCYYHYKTVFGTSILPSPQKKDHNELGEKPAVNLMALSKVQNSPMLQDDVCIAKFLLLLCRYHFY